jgi:malonyl CoA-acyl carrier protein transacylase
MALLQTRLKAKIKAAFEAEQSEEVDHNASIERISDKLAKAIIEEIQFLQINYTTGLVAPNGPVTGTITHTVI